MVKEGKLISVLRGRLTTYRAGNATDGLGGNRWARLCWRCQPFSWCASCVGRPLTDREGIEFTFEFDSGIHNCPIPENRETAVYHVDERPWKCTIRLLSGSNPHRLIFSNFGFFTALFSPIRAKQGRSSMKDSGSKAFIQRRDPFFKDNPSTVRRRQAASDRPPMRQPPARQHTPPSRATPYPPRAGRQRSDRR